MINPKILHLNLAALKQHSPELCEAIHQAPSCNSCEIVLSRNNLPVPVVKYESGARALHSLVDPIREGERFAAQSSHEGFMVFLGLGGGYHILPFMKQKTASAILILETDLSFLKMIFSSINFADLMADERVHLLIDPTERQIHATLTKSYMPLFHGGLQILPLRTREEEKPQIFKRFRQSLKSGLDVVAADFSTQAQLGCRWFVNTIHNLSRFKNPQTLPIGAAPKQIAITAAGPSLENQIGRIVEKRDKFFLLATDTSVPVLLQHGVRPDMVISIDCQQASYHHFIQGYPVNVPLVADLGSPPDITRIPRFCYFVCSSHPLSQFIKKYWADLPVVDTSGGTVTYAAVAFAEWLGAERIYLFGADFSFPFGKTYARGTYIYPYFRTREKRTAPMEKFSADMLYIGDAIHLPRSGAKEILTTQKLLSFKSSVESLSGALNASLHQASDAGLPLHIHRRQRPRQHDVPPGNLPIVRHWTQFLESYRDSLKSLPPPENPLTRYAASLTELETELLATILPTAAVFWRTHNLGKTPEKAIIMAKSYAIATIDMALI